MPQHVPTRAIWALGITQIVGYGSLYYAFSVLAPSIGGSFDLKQEWVYAALSSALLAGGLASPIAGHLIDRFGTRRVMTFGSVLSAFALVATAMAPNAWAFCATLVAMEVVSTLVLYTGAFAALVQIGGSGAQRSITQLTLIAGFASTLFWPLTSYLLSLTDWRTVYLTYGILNLILCAPLHWWIGSLVRSNPVPSFSTGSDVSVRPVQARPRLQIVLLMIGFAIEGFVLSGILMHIAPLLTQLQLGSASIVITTLFGPAQVLSRLINMGFGKRLPQTHLGIIAASLPPMAIAVLAAFAPSEAAGVAFAILFGLGSGLTSIVSGSLPLELFGRDRYGARLGWLSAARQVASAISPFVLAIGMASVGLVPSLALIVALGVTGIGVFVAIAWAASISQPTPPQPQTRDSSLSMGGGAPRRVGRDEDGQGGQLR